MSTYVGPSANLVEQSLEKMRHMHIIELYEIIDTTKYVILAMEYVGGGSLHGYLKAKPNRRVE